MPKTKMPKIKTPKIKINPRPSITTIIDDERSKLVQMGEIVVPDLLTKLVQRVEADLSLIGIDVRGACQSMLRSYLDARRPDWTQPGFDWYEADLLIPFDEAAGKEVELFWATEAHLIAYAEIRFAGLEAFRKAEQKFQRNWNWIKKNLNPGERLGDLMARRP